MYSINKKQESCCMRVIENAVKKTEKVFAFSVFLCVVFARCVFIDRGRFFRIFLVISIFSLDCRVCLSFYRINYIIIFVSCF